MAKSELRKPDIFVVARLLDKMCGTNGAMLRTRLQVACNLNYDAFSRYLDWLSSRGLVQLQAGEDGAQRVVITRKGADAYRKLIDWMNEFVREIE